MSSNLTLSTDNDLEKTWRLVVQEFSKEANLDWAKVKKPSIEDVISKIDPKEAKPATKSRAKDFVNDTLSFVQKLGKIISPLAGMALGPSEQCFNALNFVIVAVQDYKKIFEDLTLLLERVSVFLRQLNIYIEDQDDRGVTLDERLRPSVYRVLEHFMAIMTLTVQFKSKKFKVKAFAKTLLLGDGSGVTEALAMLETRVSDVVRIQVSVIGKDLSKAAQDIRTMKTDLDLILRYDEDTRNSLKRLEENQEAKGKLSVIHSSLNLDTLDLARRRHAQIAEERVENTGHWLFSRNEAFVSWSDIEKNTPPMILVIGEPGCGKTFLASAVLAQADSAYRDFLAKACKKNVGNNTMDEIWQNLVVKYEPKDETRFFMVIDGVQSSADASPLSSVIGTLTSQQTERQSKDGLQLRLFVTTVPQINRKLPDGKGMTKISLVPGPNNEVLVPNIDDVQEVISERLLQLPIFRNDTSLSEMSKNQLIKAKVSQNVQNCFWRLDLLLREFEQCVNQRQLDKIIRQLTDDTSVKIYRQIERLNKTLHPDEILVVNALLMCVQSFSSIGCPLNLDVIEQYVDLSLETPLFYSLKIQIEKRYHTLFVVDTDNIITWRYEMMSKHLIESAKDDKTMDEIHKKRGKRYEGVDLEELDLLEKIVCTNLTNTLGTHGQKLYDRYGFADFFESRRGQRKATIRLDVSESHIHILNMSLKALCEDVQGFDTDRIRRFTHKNLFRLIEQADLRKASPKQVKSIGACLVRLLRRDGMIDKWSKDKFSRAMMGDCFREVREDIKSWLSKKRVAEALENDNEKELVGKDPAKSCIKESMHDWLHRMCPESKEILMLKRMAELEKSVMNELDRKWLKEKCEEIRKSEPGNEWVRKFLKGERVEPQDPLQHSPKEKKTPVKNEYRKAQSGREFRGPFA
ncbi:hypothetical protein COCVIDRAFT_17119 [Bipolaris victoriae FI3]|uniref:Fungal STAND N-terminal Goodbye domain-containing protein n=1 Tax=Bipolaris victoriae (strain FI3) TaxID=930091 RepID=W7E5G6_BIPV3|nr:hypothetical protein COCVIDRAFT_17119 [Bipolaris victoriae FI3]